jgi:dihydrolipoamide dehydrogenase
MATQKFDVVIVGSGPGGYVAAIRAAQLDLSVAVVEEDRPGGVCLNWGCIPTKALLKSAEVVSLLHRASEFGVALSGFTADYSQAHSRSRRIADRLAKGVEFLFKKNKITLIPGRGSLAGPTSVRVAKKEGAEELQARAVILATGSEPKSLPGVAIDEGRVISSTGALRMEAAPQAIAVIGAGAVGVEFAEIYAAYGAQVTLLEALPRILPLEDEEASAQIARIFSRRGIDVKAGAKVTAVNAAEEGVAIEAEIEGKSERIACGRVLMAVGRSARTSGIGLEALGVAVERGFVKVSPKMESSVKGLYAVGDVAGPPLLAHKAMAEGVVAAEAIAGIDPRPVDYGNIPSCTYCRPQVASIGMTEAQAKANGRELAVGRFPFTANGKALAMGEHEGFVKVVADRGTGEILGVHIVGSEATEIIHEFAVGRTLEATLEEMVHTIHAHPTLSEAALEATLAALGRAIHI